ncbi:hypothetical protein RQP46_000552 [Phenoliferia psychrophenolica]
MSALPSLPLPFLAAIGVLGAPDSPPRLRCPPHLNVEFGAFFYAGPEGTQHSGASPYVGTIDLEAHFLARLAATAPATDFPLPPLPPPSFTSSTNHSKSTARPPKFPGYRVPQRGQVQIIVKNENSTAIKLFLIPYDLTGLDRGGLGGKTFLRQKSYTVDVDGSDDPSTPPRKGRLRFAVHLQFCSPPSSSPSSSNLDPKSHHHPPPPPKAEPPSYYLHQTIRVVFASRALDSTEKLRVEAEGPQGALPNHEGLGDEVFAPYKGPGVNWEMARKKAKVRSARAKAGTGEGPLPPPPPPPKQPSTGVKRGFEPEVEAEEEDEEDDENRSGKPHLSASPPLPPPSLSSLSLSYIAPLPIATPLNFDRPTSPLLALKSPSALSRSRPTSPRAFSERLEEQQQPRRHVPDAGR